MNGWSSNQMHLDTELLNNFLVSKLQDRGIEILKIQSMMSYLMKMDKFIKCETQDYSYDYYVDCTGLKGLLIRKFDGINGYHIKMFTS